MDESIQCLQGRSDQISAEKNSFNFSTCFAFTLRLLGMSWGVKTTCLEAPGVSPGGSGVSIGGVGFLMFKKNSIEILFPKFEVEHVQLFSKDIP